MTKAYLSSIRADTNYPTFRKLITVATLLGYVVAVILLVAGFFLDQIGGILIAIIVAVVTALAANLGQEVSLMIADIADATIESAVRRSQPTALQELLKQQPTADLLAKRTESSATVAAPVVASAAGPTPEHTSHVQTKTCKNCFALIQENSNICPRCKTRFDPEST